jgi:hypothetical protein
LSRENAAVSVGAENEGVGCRGEGLDLLKDTEFPQYVRGVGRYLDTRSDLLRVSW